MPPNGERPWRMELYTWPVMGTARQGGYVGDSPRRVPHKLTTSWCVSPARTRCPTLLGLRSFGGDSRVYAHATLPHLRVQVMFLNSSTCLIVLNTFSFPQVGKILFHIYKSLLISRCYILRNTQLAITWNLGLSSFQAQASWSGQEKSIESKW